MPQVQSRVFHRAIITVSPDAIATAFTELQNEVNVFTAPFPIGDVLDIQFQETNMTRSTGNNWLLIRAVVHYIQP